MVRIALCVIRYILVICRNISAHTRTSKKNTLPKDKGTSYNEDKVQRIIYLSPVRIFVISACLFVALLQVL